jgi:hypothetical protein
MLAADGCASGSGQPGVLLLRRLGLRRAGGVAVAMSWLSLVWHAHLHERAYRLTTHAACRLGCWPG